MYANLKTYLSEKCELIDAALDQYLPEESIYPEIIYKAMRYSVFNGGKRIRPILSLAACEAVGGDQNLAMPAGCAIELIHAFSLIHDDLPALDNDDLRRGKPTNHKMFGEAIAILAGDALFARAFEIIASRTIGVPHERILDVTRRIAAAAGTSGMVVGQVVDIICEGETVPADTLVFMHKNKTGALIEASVVSGGILGGGSDSQIEALSTYGWMIGQAFQIHDDILDIEGDEENLGKPVGSDIRNAKTTYPSLYGLEKSKELAIQAISKALTSLSQFDDKADPLRSIAHYIIERKS
ncbi:MAG: polyprenyl synthetase family protein [Armatimonadota bacterium]